MSIHQNTSSGSINLHHYQSTQCCILNPDLSLPILMHQQCANVSTYIFTNQQKMSANISAISIQPDTSTVADAVRFSLTPASPFSQNQLKAAVISTKITTHQHFTLKSTFHIDVNIPLGEQSINNQQWATCTNNPLKASQYCSHQLNINKYRIFHDSNATLYTPAKKPGSCP